MFDRQFEFDNKEKETISDEIRRLLENTGISQSAEECDYLVMWKDKILELSGNN